MGPAYVQDDMTWLLENPRCDEICQTWGLGREYVARVRGGQRPEVWEVNGDASPTNTNKKVAPHFRRCACTRASARALRLALGVDLVAVEELSEAE